MNRLVPLAGGRNFRDLGGYPTAGGGSVRWRRLFRSGLMSYLTEADCDYLATLGIRVLCDFRTTRERTRAAIRWRGDVERLSWEYDAKRFSLRGLLQDTEPTAHGLEQAMIRLYQALPTHFAAPYRAMFARLAQGDLPLVISCSAGKDRTGVAAALVLTALGVSRQHILSDYVLTNQLIDLERTFFEHPGGSVGLDDARGSFARLTPEVRAPLLKAAPVYLEAAFLAIEREHGSIGAYLETVLGVSPSQLTLIRANLLEPVSAGGVQAE